VVAQGAFGKRQGRGAAPGVNRVDIGVRHDQHLRTLDVPDPSDFSAATMFAVRAAS